MSTLNNVFKKLESIDKVSQVNLESQKIELATIDDLKSAIAEGKKLEASLYSDFKNVLNGVIQQARAIEVKYNVLLSNINEPLFQSQKQAKDLGLDFNATDYYKQSQTVIKAIEERKQVIDDITKNIQKFGF